MELLGLGASLLAELMLLLLLPVLVLLHHEKLLLVWLLGGVIVKHERPWPWRLHVELLGHRRRMHPSSSGRRSGIVHIRSSTILRWLLLLRLQRGGLLTTAITSHIDIDLKRLLIPMLLLRLLHPSRSISNHCIRSIRLRSIRISWTSSRPTLPFGTLTIAIQLFRICMMTSP